MIAVLEAYRAGLLHRRAWTSDLLAGVVVGVVALPLSMAFAIASGVKPEQGLYTAIVAGMVVALFGGSRVQIAGPTGAFIVILSAIVERHGVAGLQEATFLAGLILLAMGVAGFGAVIRFIPDPVILGFTAGIGLIIAFGQVPDFLGLPIHLHGQFHQRLAQLAQALPQTRPATVLLGLAALATVLSAPRLPGLARVPGPLLALVLCTALQALLRPAGVATIGSQFGGIPSSLPWPQWPDWQPSRMLELIGPAFTIAILGAIESLLSAVVADSMAETRHDPNQELIGQGLANLLCPLCGGIAATGAIARTATNVRNGGRSPLAGLVHALTLVLIVLLLAPLAVHVPLAALAGILLVVAWNMSEPARLWAMVRRAPRADVVILAVTLLLTVFADLVVAVNIGVILATLQFLRRMASSVEVRALDEHELRGELGSRGLADLPHGLMVFVVDGPLFFAAVDQFERALQLTRSDLRVLILRLRWVPFMDATGLAAFDAVLARLRARGVEVLLSGANPRVLGKLERAGISAGLGTGRVFEEFPQALLAARALLEGAA